MPAKKKKQTKSSKLFSALNPTTPLKKFLMFIVVFALVGGGYYLYKSHAATCVWTTQSYGASNTCVNYIQGMVNYQNHVNIAVDGVFGTSTKSQVIWYQTVYKKTFNSSIRTDGVVDAKTWLALCDAHMSIAKTTPMYYYAKAAGCPGY